MSLTQGQLLGLVGAQPGLRASVTAPRGTSPDVIGQAPPGGEVVAWTLVADPDQPGGAVVEPVFLAAGRAWTPGQYRAEFGQILDVMVSRTR